MRINKIEDTCSMLELGSLIAHDLDCYHFKTLSEFKHRLDIKLKENGLAKTSEKNYAILYNCSNSNHIPDLKRLGFKQVYTYQGYGDGKVRVFILDVNKERKSFFQKIKNFIN